VGRLYYDQTVVDVDFVVGFVIGGVFTVVVIAVVIKAYEKLSYPISVRLYYNQIVLESYKVFWFNANFEGKERNNDFPLLLTFKCFLIFCLKWCIRVLKTVTNCR